MKMKLFFLAASLSIISIITACVKTKNYNCECTYVADSLGPNAGQPNKVENTTVKGRLHEQATIECSGLEGKYMSDFYTGTCLIK